MGGVHGAGGQGRVWGFPVSLIVSPCRAGPSRALLRRVAARWPSATLDRPSRPGHTKTAGKPPKERAGPSLWKRGSLRRPSGPGVRRPRDGPIRRGPPGRWAHPIATRSSSLSACDPSWAGHRPPTGLGCFSSTASGPSRGRKGAGQRLCRHGDGSAHVGVSKGRPFAPITLVCTLAHGLSPSPPRIHDDMAEGSAVSPSQRPRPVVGRAKGKRQRVVGGLCPAPDGRRTLRDEERVAIGCASPDPAGRSRWPGLGSAPTPAGSRISDVPVHERKARPVPLGVSRQSSDFRGGTVGQGWPKAIAQRRDDEGGAPLRDRPDTERR
ncbi:hypothetical protein SAVIM40S_05798 [Streptomyces avidinii]|uniref:Uncharacterized protein n=1 Tax=Streptomyces avidinii TaxID=1895 RepID=A0ABS4L1W7_STRAV|nr:hypothetical protein [Streptomyces avidinii]